MRWKKLAYSLIAVLAAIIGGGLIGALLGMPAAEGQMLASGAIVFFYLLIGAIVGGAFAGFLSYRWTERKVGKLAISMVFIAVVAWLIVAKLARERRQERASDPPAPTSSLAPETRPTSLAAPQLYLVPAAAPSMSKGLRKKKG